MCGEDFEHEVLLGGFNALEELTLFNFHQLWKIRRQIPGLRISVSCLVWFQIANIVISWVCFLVALGILHETQDAADTPCAEEYWIWTYCQAALFAPIVIGVVLLLGKMACFQCYWDSKNHQLETQHDSMKRDQNDLWKRYFALFVNLLHPIGRTIGAILGIFLIADMPDNCHSFYAQWYPNLLTLLNLLLFGLVVSAIMGYVVFMLAVFDMQVNTPRYLITALANLEDLGPFHFYKTHTILMKDGEEDRSDTTVVQLALLLATAVYSCWGASVLLFDDEARTRSCASASPIWTFVLLALLLIPLAGLIVVALRSWKARQRALDREAGGRYDLYIAISQPIVTLVMGVVGAVMASNMTSYCSAEYQDGDPDLLFFFEFQVVVLLTAAVLGVAVFVAQVARRSLHEYQLLLEVEDPLERHQAEHLYYRDSFRHSGYEEVRERREV